MRRVIAAAMVALALCGCTCTLAGCGTIRTEGEADTTERLFDAIPTGYLGWYIYVHRQTGCQYFVAGSRTPVLLVDKYGYPLLADGYSRVEIGMSDDDGE